MMSPLFFFTLQTTPRKRTVIIPRSLILFKIIISRWISPGGRSEILVGGAFVRWRRRFARQRGADEEKKWRARVTDARTYANTMNYVMAGNSCPLRRAPMLPPERRARIRTPHTRPPCFSQHFSRLTTFGRDRSLMYQPPTWAIRSVAAKTDIKADKRPFRHGYCSRAGRPVSGGGDRQDGYVAMAEDRGGPATSARVRHCLMWIIPSTAKSTQYE